MAPHASEALWPTLQLGHGFLGSSIIRSIEGLRTVFKITGKFYNLRDEEISDLRVRGFIQTLGADGEEAAASLMSLFEDLALAVRSGYVNESTTFRSLGPVTVEYIQGLRPYIFHIQQDRGNKVYFEDALLLLKHWKSGDSFRGELGK
jgi:hypothetical protein